MQKIHFKILTFLQRSGKEKLNPNTLWRTMIGMTTLFVIVSATMGVFSYQIASISSNTIMVGKPESDVMSADEIRMVVNQYKAKQLQFQQLLNTRPTPPSINKGIGVEVLVTEVPTTNDTLSTGESNATSSRLQ